MELLVNKNITIQRSISSPIHKRSLNRVFWRGTLRQAENKFQSIQDLGSIVEVRILKFNFSISNSVSFLVALIR